MIIGINGKIGSGKDTIGKIIQYLTYPYDVDIETYLNKEVNGQFEIKSNVHSVPNVEIKKFAGKLKQIGSLLTGIDVEKFEDQDFKKSHLGSEWGTIRSNPLNAVPVFEDVQFNELMTVREFLQKLGTEAMRDRLHTNVWVNALFADYIPVVQEWDELGNDTLVEYPNWIITDMRFPNEMEAVVNKGGITIRVVRPETTVGTHPSETALDDAKFDYEIINDGTMEELVKKVREVLVNEGLI